YAATYTARKAHNQMAVTIDFAAEQDRDATEDGEVAASRAQKLVRRIGHLFLGPLYWVVASVTPLLFMLMLALKLDGKLDVPWRHVFSPLFVLLPYSWLNACAA